MVRSMSEQKMILVFLKLVLQARNGKADWIYPHP